MLDPMTQLLLYYIGIATILGGAASLSMWWKRRKKRPKTGEEILSERLGRNFGGRG